MWIRYRPPTRRSTSATSTPSAPGACHCLSASGVVQAAKSFSGDDAKVRRISSLFSAVRWVSFCWVVAMVRRPWLAWSRQGSGRDCRAAAPRSGDSARPTPPHPEAAPRRDAHVEPGHPVEWSRDLPRPARADAWTRLEVTSRMAAQAPRSPFPLVRAAQASHVGSGRRGRGRCDRAPIGSKPYGLVYTLPRGRQERGGCGATTVAATSSSDQDSAMCAACRPSANHERFSKRRIRAAASCPHIQPQSDHAPHIREILRGHAVWRQHVYDVADRLDEYALLERELLERRAWRTCCARRRVRRSVADCAFRSTPSRDVE